MNANTEDLITLLAPVAACLSLQSIGRALVSGTLKCQDIVVASGVVKPRSTADAVGLARCVLQVQVGDLPDSVDMTSVREALDAARKLIVAYEIHPVG
jgi:hypothetical protein